MTDQKGEIPQSPALREASPESLSEVMSRDPEGYSEQDWGIVVSALRADRTNRERAEQLAAQSGKKKPKAQKVVLPSNKTAEELGL
jgi:hypothetical protein